MYCNWKVVDNESVRFVQQLLNKKICCTETKCQSFFTPYKNDCKQMSKACLFIKFRQMSTVKKESRCQKEIQHKRRIVVLCVVFKTKTPFGLI